MKAPRHLATRRLALAAAATTTGAALALLVGSVSTSACSLGLDESKILADANVVPDGAPGVLPDGGIGPLPDGAPRPDTGAPAGDASACTQDSDCKASNACLKGRCDALTHACLFDACVQANACSSSTCDVSAESCALPQSYGFHASSFPVARGNAACNGSVSRCFAAVWPYVFVGTVNRIEAYGVANAANASPPSVSVTGIPFLPQFIVSSGRRVYFIASPGQAFPDYRLAVAWVDVPGDPFVTTIAAHSQLLVYPHSSISAVYATVDGGVFVVNGDASRAYPTGILRAPLHDGDRVATFPLSGIAKDAFPVAASGSRIIAYRYDNTPGVYTPSFSFQPNAATAGAQAGPETSVVTMGPLVAQGTFAQGPDGNVLFSAPALVAEDAGLDIPAVRTAWLVENGSAAAFDVGARVDVESYVPSAPQGGQFAGPVAWLDTKRALVTAAYRDDRSQTVVQVISRAQLPPSTLPNRRFVLPANVGNIGVAGSQGNGYVLAPDGNDGLTVHVFAPSCPP